MAGSGGIDLESDKRLDGLGGLRSYFDFIAAELAVSCPQENYGMCKRRGRIEGGP